VRRLRWHRLRHLLDEVASSFASSATRVPALAVVGVRNAIA
jgi:hypothetical protein